MFVRNIVSHARIPVALFNTKHFQCRHKSPVTPAGLSDTFSSLLSLNDRLLRQSTVGGGSNRVLVLDRHQQVKGVYHPLLCLPHPSALSTEEESTLGMPVEGFLQAILPKLPPGAKKRAKPVPPTTLTILSHPYGIAFAVFSGDGAYQVQLQNFPITRSDQEEGDAATASSQEAPAAPTASMIVASKSLFRAVSTVYAKSVEPCSTFYFVTRDKKASMTLPTLEKIAELVKEEVTPPFSFVDKRWVQMSDVVFHGSKGVSLYGVNAAGEEVVDSKGLQEAVTHGTLELDYVPKKKEEKTE